MSAHVQPQPSVPFFLPYHPRITASPPRPRTTTTRQQRCRELNLYPSANDLPSASLHVLLKRPSPQRLFSFDALPLSTTSRDVRAGAASRSFPPIDSIICLNICYIRDGFDLVNDVKRHENPCQNQDMTRHLLVIELKFASDRDRIRWVIWDLRIYSGTKFEIQLPDMMCDELPKSQTCTKILLGAISGFRKTRRALLRRDAVRIPPGGRRSAGVLTPVVKDISGPRSARLAFLGGVRGQQSREIDVIKVTAEPRPHPFQARSVHLSTATGAVAILHTPHIQISYYD
ncbi:hypothetical protein GGX14DRAFT_388089 [Mycena pura]|uniref:Uncharacterized protein n=1 Tax=Mycena pura TaxID=153505 RepID=A0AAD6VU66_9AGAR|nr:hypothetical protein GGX14DRAFT_388089 [Mycena pura]